VGRILSLAFWSFESTDSSPVRSQGIRGGVVLLLKNRNDGGNLQFVGARLNADVFSPNKRGIIQPSVALYKCHY
jgi:hypothetical protein